MVMANDNSNDRPRPSPPAEQIRESPPDVFGDEPSQPIDVTDTLKPQRPTPPPADRGDSGDGSA